jgi:hypothetical protein
MKIEDDPQMIANTKHYKNNNTQKTHKAKDQ